jgi:hypothetical protein
VKAVFQYTEEEVKAALLNHHRKRIDFQNGYKVTVELSSDGYFIFVEEFKKEPKTKKIFWLKDRIASFFAGVIYGPKS